MNNKKNNSYIEGKEAVEALETSTSEELKEERRVDRVRIVIHLKKRLSERGMTQMELSEKADVRQATISQLSRGHVERLHVPTIEKIAHALEIEDITQLITLELESEIMNMANPFDVEF